MQPSKKNYALKYFIYHTVPSLVILLLFVCVSATACDVPVFSYAMQNWHADPYVIHIFYHEALTAEEEALFQKLKHVSVSDTGLANIEVNAVNLEATEDAGLLELYSINLAETAPGLLVSYPVSTRIVEPLYAGPLNKTVVAQLLDSPVRREISKRLLQGETSVWILLESGNRRKDNQAAQLLEAELERMTRVLQLPDKSLWAWSNTIDTQAGVRISMLRVSRDAPGEAMLVKMLLGSEADLARHESKPLTFPIYGRGLILYALVGEGINEWTIADACEFVVGPCPCVVKASNPGTDLLMSVDWKKNMQPIQYFEQPLVAGLGGFFDRGEEAANRLAALDSKAQTTDTPSSEEDVRHAAALNDETQAEASASAEEVPSRHYLWWLGGGSLVVAVFGVGFLYNRFHNKEKVV